MTRIKPKDIVIISRLVITLFRYMRDGLDKDERYKLADDLADVIGELMK